MGRARDFQLAVQRRVLFVERASSHTLTNTVSFCLPFHTRSHEKRQGSGQSGHRFAQRCVLLGAGSPQFAVQHIQVQGDRGRGAATAVAARVPERLAAGRRAATVSSTQHAGARV